MYIWKKKKMKKKSPWSTNEYAKQPRHLPADLWGKMRNRNWVIIFDDGQCPTLALLAVELSSMKTWHLDRGSYPGQSRLAEELAGSKNNHNTPPPLLYTA